MLHKNTKLLKLQISTHLSAWKANTTDVTFFQNILKVFHLTLKSFTSDWVCFSAKLHQHLPISTSHTTLSITVPCRAANKCYFLLLLLLWINLLLIFSIVCSIKCHKTVLNGCSISQSPMWYLEKCCFVCPTAQNPTIFSSLSHNNQTKEEHIVTSEKLEWRNVFNFQFHQQQFL